MFMFKTDSVSNTGHVAVTSSGPIPSGRKRLLPLRIPALLVFLLAACSGGSDPVIVGESPVTQPRGSLIVEPASFILSEGETVSLAAKLGTTPVGASQLSWSVSPASLASVDAYGTLTANKHGEATVTARYSSLKATSQATIWAIPNGIEAASAKSLAGTVGRSLSDSVAVRAVSSDGTPVPGVDVLFEIQSGEGTLSHTTKTTGLDGIARIDWVLGTEAGAQGLRAHASQLGELSFSVQAAPDFDSVTVEILGGDEQEAEVATFLPEALRAKVTDQYGNPLPGLAMEWVFSHGGGAYGSNGGPDSASPVVPSVTDAEWDDHRPMEAGHRRQEIRKPSARSPLLRPQVPQGASGGRVRPGTDGGDGG